MLKVVFTVVAFATLALSAPSGPGTLVAWPAVGEAPPSGDFVALAAAGGAQFLAIRADRTLYLSTVPGTQPQPIPQPTGALATDEFCGVGLGRDHALAIRLDGSVVAWGDWGVQTWSEPATVGPATTGHFVAVTGAGAHSAALDTTGRVLVWGSVTDLAGDYHKVVGVGAPAGMTFKAIAAKGRHTLALSTDGNIYGWGVDTFAPGVVADVFNEYWTPYGTDYFVAPFDAGNPYTAIAAGLNLVAALREDGSVVVWDATDRMDAAPSGVFTHIAAGSSYAAAIDHVGQLHAWGDRTVRAAIINGVPDGVYSAVSASNARVTAITSQPDSTPPVITDLQVNPDALWPPNHKMKTVTLTFRADDNCMPVAVSGLSVTLRSNQPDNGSGSGNTTGDTNGQDGYSAPATVPVTAIAQNPDGSFRASFQLRAERSNALSGTRTYSVSIVASDTATPPNMSALVTAEVVVGHGGQ